MAFAQHDHDVEFYTDNGQLFIVPGGEGFLFEADLSEGPNSTTDPGFNNDDFLSTNPLSPDENLKLKVLSSLLYFNTATQAIESPGSAILRVVNLSPSSSANVDAFNGIGLEVNFGEADLAGAFHKHITFLLEDPLGTPGGPTGVYGLHAQLFGSVHGASQPFLIAFAQGLDLLNENEFELFEEGAAALYAVAIPEPSTAIMAAMALAGLIGFRRRKRVC